MANNNHIRIGCWNIQGLYSKTVDKTLDEGFLNNIVGTDIVALVETHTVEGQNNIKAIAGYETKYFNRPKHTKAPHGSGGIAILFKPQLREGLKFFPARNNDYIWIKLDKTFFNRNHDIYICAAYIPPPNSTYTKRLEENILDCIETDIYKHKALGEIILLGDLNGRVGTLSDFIINDDDQHVPLGDDYTIDNTQRTRYSQDTQVDDRGKHILEICIAAQLRLLNGRKLGDSLGYFTSHQYNGSSVVDYAICSSNLIHDIPYFKVHPFLGTLADHCMISFLLKAKTISRPETKINLNTLPRQFKWTEESPERFKAALQLPQIKKLLDEAKTTLSTCTDKNTINMAAGKITSILTEAAKLTLKMKGAKKSKEIKKPWTTTKIKRLEKEVHRKGQTMVKTQTGEDRRNFFLALKTLRKERKYSRRHYIKTQIDKLNSIKDTNPRQFWQVLQELKDGNKECHADKIAPGTWYNYLMQNNKTRSNNEDDSILEEAMKSLNTGSFNELDFKIKNSEFNEALLKLKNNKSPGLDQILNEMVKNSDYPIQECIINLFNKIFTIGIYPDCWAAGCITNIHKKGSFLDPQNYRSITITSSLGKLFNSILARRLQNYLDKYKLIAKEQIGFTRDSSTSDHIFTLQTLINKYTQKKSQKLYACFVDFRQAFDRVWHMGLFYKLSKLNINNHFLRIIKNMYGNIKLCTKTQSHHTDLFASHVGVRQGDNLSPILFNLYVNDLPQYINTMENTDPLLLGNTKLNCLMYADDIVLLSTSRIGLQKCIQGMKEFSDKWKLEVNLDKTKALIFNKKGSHLSENLFLGENAVECVSNYTYLGLEFDCSGALRNAVQKLYEKGLKAVFKLYKLTEHDYDIKTILYIFDHTIVPILIYGAETWGFEFAKIGKNNNTDNYFEKHLDNNVLTQLEIKFYKRLLRVKRHTATLAVRSELGRHPVTLKAIGRSIKYFHQVAQKPDHKLIKQAMAESINLDSRGIKTWFTQFRTLRDTLNLPQTPLTHTKHGLKTFSRKTERSLEIKYEHFWDQELNSATGKQKNKGGNKLRTYNKLKQNFAMEKYLTLIEDTSHRTALTQIRLSSHPLNIETLRGQVTNPNDRICKMCTLNIMEDEFHFIAECPKYKPLRDKLNECITNTPNANTLDRESKTIWLLTNENKTLCKSLGKYIFEGFKIRKLSINQST